MGKGAELTDTSPGWMKTDTSNIWLRADDQLSLP